MATVKPNEVPANNTMSTDQRLALLLRSKVMEVKREAERLRTEGGGNPVTDFTRLLNRQATHLENIAERLEELIEGLAGHNVFVVDEYKMVQALEDSFDADRKYTEATRDPHYSPLRVAQLAVQDLKEAGALR